MPSTNLYYRSTYHLYQNGIYFGGPAAGKSYSVLLLFLLLHYFVLSMLYAFPAFAGSFFPVPCRSAFSCLYRGWRLRGFYVNVFLRYYVVLLC